MRAGGGWRRARRGRCPAAGGDVAREGEELVEKVIDEVAIKHAITLDGPASCLRHRRRRRRWSTSEAASDAVSSSCRGGGGPLVPCSRWTTAACRRRRCTRGHADSLAFSDDGRRVGSPHDGVLWLPTSSSHATHAGPASSTPGELRRVEWAAPERKPRNLGDRAARRLPEDGDGVPLLRAATTTSARSAGPTSEHLAMTSCLSFPRRQGRRRPQSGNHAKRSRSAEAGAAGAAETDAEVMETEGLDRRHRGRQRLERRVQRDGACLLSRQLVAPRSADGSRRPPRSGGVDADLQGPRTSRAARPGHPEVSERPRSTSPSCCRDAGDGQPSSRAST